MSQHFDVIIIGAGMSGMSAAIRLAMFDKKVCLIEKHSIAGGLNSYYQRGKRQLDVGLHALTNYSQKNERTKPLGKLLKQLRISHDEWNLQEQNHSVIQFGSNKLIFTNDINDLANSITQLFPSESNSFLNFVEEIKNHTATTITNEPSARKYLAKFFKSEQLIEMILCPLLIYGSASEHDLDTDQMIIMFHALYLQGFSRPQGGVRIIISSLLKKINDHGVNLRFKTSIAQIITNNNVAIGVVTDKGEEIYGKQIFSSIGLPETLSLLKEQKPELVGKMSFTETIMYFDQLPKDWDCHTTICFYNESIEKYNYRCPNELFDSSSAVVCFPNNYKNDKHNEGIVRITFMANNDLWLNLSTEEYKFQKQIVLDESLKLLKKLVPNFFGNLVYSDVFTPKTITRYTSHFAGCVYGSPKKLKDGKTNLNELYLIGNDQGFLGVVGSMLSGISIANMHGLKENL